MKQRKAATRSGFRGSNNGDVDKARPVAGGGEVTVRRDGVREEKRILPPRFSLNKKRNLYQY